MHRSQWGWQNGSGRLLSGENAVDGWLFAKAGERPCLLNGVPLPPPASDASLEKGASTLCRPCFDFLGPTCFEAAAEHPSSMNSFDPSQDFDGLHEDQEWSVASSSGADNGSLDRRHFNSLFAKTHPIRRLVGPATVLVEVMQVLVGTLKWLPTARVWVHALSMIKNVVRFKKRLRAHRIESRRNRHKLLDAMLQYWRASERKLEKHLRKTAQAPGAIPEKRQLSAHHLATCHIPDVIKQRVIWELYWVLREQFSHALAQHNVRLRQALRERAIAAAALHDCQHYFSHLRPSDAKDRVLLDATIFVLILQTPKFRFAPHGALNHRELMRLANETSLPRHHLPGQRQPTTFAHSFMASPLCTDPRWMLRSNSMCWPLIPPLTWQPDRGSPGRRSGGASSPDKSEGASSPEALPDSPTRCGSPAKRRSTILRYKCRRSSSHPKPLPGEAPPGAHGMSLFDMDSPRWGGSEGPESARADGELPSPSCRRQSSARSQRSDTSGSGSGCDDSPRWLDARAHSADIAQLYGEGPMCETLSMESVSSGSMSDTDVGAQSCPALIQSSDRAGSVDDELDAFDSMCFVRPPTDIAAPVLADQPPPARHPPSLSAGPGGPRLQPLQQSAGRRGSPLRTGASQRTPRSPRSPHSIVLRLPPSPLRPEESKYA